MTIIRHTIGKKLTPKIKYQRKKMFTKTQRETILKKWGQEVYIRILNEIEIYTDKWKLSDMHFNDSYSMNAIFFCNSETYGECVLKIGSNFQDKEFVWEYNILREYKGRRFIKVYESEIDISNRKKVMLIERVNPGTQLESEKSLDKRLSVFSELFNGLHIEPEDPLKYKKYIDGVNDCVDMISKNIDHKELYSHMLKAKDIFLSLSAAYQKEVLLHGDLQFHNILLKGNGKYIISDPQGRIGAYIFDIPRYILIEYYNMSKDKRFDKINYIITYLEKSLNVPGTIIKQCFYIETTKFECYLASLDDYNKDISTVIFAETIMKN